MNIRETGLGICVEFNYTAGDFGIISA